MQDVGHAAIAVCLDNEAYITVFFYSPVIRFSDMSGEKRLLVFVCFLTKYMKGLVICATTEINRELIQNGKSHNIHNN